jgi:hypothetical protein
MKTKQFALAVAITAIAAVVLTQTGFAQFAPPPPAPSGSQQPAPRKHKLLEERNMGGPRLGMTYVLGDTRLTKELAAKKMDPLMSQFGWHFEYDVVPAGGGPAFVIQFVPLISGVEYGTIVPSTSLMMGIRMPGGFEFGLGPNVLLAPVNSPTSLVMAIGKSFDYDGVSIPINLAFTTNRDGNRVTLLFGYAID